MNEKRLHVLTYCLVAVFIFIVTLGVLTSCKRSSKSTVKPRPKTPAEVAEEKISEYSHPEAVISVHELNDIYNDSNVAILDTRGRTFQIFQASFYAGAVPRAIPILYAEYLNPAHLGRITTPSIAEKVLGGKGINNQKRIVLYGNDGLQARVYWMLKLYGSDNDVQILDGGYEKWKEAGYPEYTPAAIVPSQFTFNPTKAYPEIYTNQEEILHLNWYPAQKKIIVDTRTRGEYLGGHIPGSVNVSVSDILNEDTTFKPAQELAAIFASKGVTPDKTVLVYSLAGVRSSLTWYVLHELLGYPNVKNYDGGIYEWVTREMAIEYIEQNPVVNPAQ
jgi:thiosulfate/3-mercaptopyruvate sulfurtransferase